MVRCDFGSGVRVRHFSGSQIRRRVEYSASDGCRPSRRFHAQTAQLPAPNAHDGLLQVSLMAFIDWSHCLLYDNIMVAMTHWCTVRSVSWFHQKPLAGLWCFQMMTSFFLFNRPQWSSDNISMIHSTRIIIIIKVGRNNSFPSIVILLASGFDISAWSVRLNSTKNLNQVV